MHSFNKLMPFLIFNQHTEGGECTQGLLHHFRQNMQHYKAVFDSNDAHEEPLAGKASNKIMRSRPSSIT
jgi:hypothetical protein